MLFSTNAFADGKIFEWMVETFEKYSSFSISEENTVDKDELDIEIRYIPEGFELDKQVNDSYLDMYYYLDDDKYLVVQFIYQDINTLLNTEDAVIEEFEIDGIKAKFWQKNQTNFIVSSKNNVGCQMYGTIDKEELIKIYKGISRNSK